MIGEQTALQPTKPNEMHMKALASGQGIGISEHTA
jgi:hypothetical protein